MLSLYLLTNQSPGYGEPELALVVAPSEDAARLAVVRHLGTVSGSTAFLFEDLTAAKVIGEPHDKYEASTVLAVGYTPA